MTTDRIEIDPKVMMGKPVIKGTRIKVELLLRKLAEGTTEDDLLDAYPRLTREDIRAPRSPISIQGTSWERAIPLTKRQAFHVAVSVLSMFLVFIGMLDLLAGIALLTLPIPSHGWSGMQYSIAGLLYFVVGILFAKWNSWSDLAARRANHHPA